MAAPLGLDDIHWYSFPGPLDRAGRTACPLGRKRSLNVAFSRLDNSFTALPFTLQEMIIGLCTPGALRDTVLYNS